MKQFVHELVLYVNNTSKNVRINTFKTTAAINSLKKEAGENCKLLTL